MDQLEIINYSPASNGKNLSSLPVKLANKSTVKNVKTTKRKCFICNENQTVDNNVNDKGG